MFDKNRINMEQSIGGNCIRVECLKEEKIDYTALKVIQNDPPEFLLRLRQRTVDNRPEFIYDMGSVISIKYLDFNMTKAEFVRLWINLLTPFMSGADWFLDYHYICVDTEYIFADRSSGNVSYIYIPAEGFRNTDEEILSFLREFVYAVQVKDGSDFLVKLYQAFGRGNTVIKELYEMALEEQGKPENSKEYIQNTPSAQPIVNEQPRQAVRPTEPTFERPAAPVVQEKAKLQKPLEIVLGHKNEKPVKEENVKQGGVLGIFGKKKDKEAIPEEPVQAEISPNEDGYEDAINALFDNHSKKKPQKENKSKEKDKKEKKGGLFSFGSKKEKKEKPQESQAGIFNTTPRPAEPIVQNVEPPVQREAIPVSSYNYNINISSDVTEIEGLEDIKEGDCLVLEDRGRMGVPERISLDFPGKQIFIGRRSNDANQPDVVFGAEHKRMGRRHACITKEEGSYYLVDLGSANATMLNGERLIPNKAYRLNNNDIVGFIATDPIKYRVVL